VGEERQRCLLVGEEDGREEESSEETADDPTPGVNQKKGTQEAQRKGV